MSSFVNVREIEARRGSSIIIAEYVEKRDFKCTTMWNILLNEHNAFYFAVI